MYILGNLLFNKMVVKGFCYVPAISYYKEGNLLVLFIKWMSYTLVSFLLDRKA